MINYNFTTDFKLKSQKKLTNWVTKAIVNEDFKLGNISYIFCNDTFLLEKNIQFLNHNTLTDILSFDYSVGKIISGDIFISIERVKENATKFKVNFLDELHRVMIHGILHYCDYNDKTDDEKKTMRSKENYYLSLRKF
jgi:rRNA maturation RNase YbeY